MSEVYMYIYDLSNGLAAQISVQLTGRHFKAIYHTAIVVYGREFFFGGSGIESSLPAKSPYGIPIEKRSLGVCNKSLEAWNEFLHNCAKDYGVGRYHLLEHNCNTFTDAAIQFLLNRRIDPEISSLPADFLNTPLGIMLRPQIDAMYSPRSNAQLVNPSVSKSEAVIDGPMSGNKKDRLSEAYTFPNCPTLSKLFSRELKGTGKPIGESDQEGARLQAVTKSILANNTTSAMQLQELHDYLVRYMRTGTVVNIYPGLDLTRVLFRYKSFANCATHSNNELLSAILSLDFADSLNAVSSHGILFKLICNLLIEPVGRVGLINALRQHEKLELISSGPLSNNEQMVELALKTIWNILILIDGIDDDFAVACLAAVAECSLEETSTLKELRVKIITEITTGASEAIQDMVDLLDIEC